MGLNGNIFENVRSFLDNYDEDLIGEIVMMKTLKHPNIVSYLDSFKYEDQLWVCFY